MFFPILTLWGHLKRKVWQTTHGCSKGEKASVINLHPKPFLTPSAKGTTNITVTSPYRVKGKNESKVLQPTAETGKTFLSTSPASCCSLKTQRYRSCTYSPLVWRSSIGRASCEVQSISLFSTTAQQRFHSNSKGKKKTTNQQQEISALTERRLRSWKQ